eukprot:TRINITY_DN544_c0_g1_i3.p1 TRINITY_DN544_c0_g1~~TRINITY_DN544_c0_g1_i3.p1  ORF type:complete len:537 (+),score=113.98 TRINITY_DN544_c0_g1_i3:574-2184(+)
MMSGTGEKPVYETLDCKPAEAKNRIDCVKRFFACLIQLFFIVTNQEGGCFYKTTAYETHLFDDPLTESAKALRKSVIETSSKMSNAGTGFHGVSNGLLGVLTTHLQRSNTGVAEAITALAKLFTPEFDVLFCEYTNVVHEMIHHCENTLRLNKEHRKKKDISGILEDLRRLLKLPVTLHDAFLEVMVHFPDGWPDSTSIEAIRSSLTTCRLVNGKAIEKNSDVQGPQTPGVSESVPKSRTPSAVLGAVSQLGQRALDSLKLTPKSRLRFSTTQKSSDFIAKCEQLQELLNKSIQQVDVQKQVIAGMERQKAKNDERAADCRAKLAREKKKRKTQKDQARQLAATLEEALEANALLQQQIDESKVAEEGCNKVIQSLQAECKRLQARVKEEKHARPKQKPSLESAQMPYFEDEDAHSFYGVVESRSPLEKEKQALKKGKRSLSEEKKEAPKKRRKLSEKKASAEEASEKKSSKKKVVQGAATPRDKKKLQWAQDHALKKAEEEMMRKIEATVIRYVISPMRFAPHSSCLIQQYATVQ